MPDQLVGIDLYLGRVSKGGHIEPRVETSGRGLGGDPSRDQGQLVESGGDVLVFDPPVEVAVPHRWRPPRAIFGDEDPGLLRKLTQGGVSVGEIIDEIVTAGNVDIVDTPSREYDEIAKEAARVAANHQHLEPLGCGSKGEDRGGRIDTWHRGMLRDRPGKLDPVSDNPYRELPSVDVLVDQVETDLPRPLIVDAARVALDQARNDIADGRAPEPEDSLRETVRAMERSSGVSVINASGVLLHTNLGRAPWSAKAIERASSAAAAYRNLEIELETGERTRRGVYVQDLLTGLTGAEAALVVNNNASALLLALAATSKDKAVPVSRGELIEIGGSYRLPAVMEASGADLVEVGTTNRTRLGDFQTALQTYRCGAILKVHPSNYRIDGFTEEAMVDELAELARNHGLPLIFDIGSGLLDVEASWLPRWLQHEPGARQALAAGADLVTFSGDKLLGGPQAGIMLGTQEVIATVRSNPLTRALRVDGVTYAALAATLEAYLDGDVTSIPFWRQALADESDLRPRCEKLAESVAGTVENGSSRVGAGSAPGISIASPVVRLAGQQGIYGRLLAESRPILSRRDAGDLLLDFRAVDPTDDEIVAAALERCL
jgi:L-seryl-tRNA(Ser) seleniumtransferase